MIATGIDLFSGAGGASVGLRQANVNVVGAVEIEADAAATYSANFPSVPVWKRDIRRVSARDVRNRLGLRVGDLTILKACPPCQGFSTLSGDRIRSEDERNSLVLAVRKFVKEFLPKFVLLENVPGFERDWRFQKFREATERLGYRTRSYVLNASAFGVPQNRRRLFFLAAREHSFCFPDSFSESSVAPTTVKEAFSSLKAEVAVDDPLSISRRVTGVVAKRIQSVPIGGSRYDLPARLQLECHRRLEKLGSRSASGPYGRIKWDSVSSTMTTRCTTVSCGAFIHPDENRGITLREAACLQTFPANYIFMGSYGSIERQIGNAVPAKLVEIVVKRLVCAKAG